jgi:hypothetical protein
MLRKQNRTSLAMTLGDLRERRGEPYIDLDPLNYASAGES